MPQQLCILKYVPSLMPKPFPPRLRKCRRLFSLFSVYLRVLAMTSTDFEVMTNDAGSTLDGWNVVDETAAQSQSLSAEVALERDATVLAAGEMKAVLSVVAPPADGSRAPLHLVAVLDRSGSMSGEKIRLVKQTMTFMLRYLSERDSLGIVEYGSDVKVAAPLTRCDQDGRARLAHALQKIQVTGQTNLSGGLLKGLELHRDGPRSAAPEGQAVQAGCSKEITASEVQRLLPRADAPPVYCPVHPGTSQVGNSYRRMSPSEAPARTESGPYGTQAP